MKKYTVTKDFETKTDTLMKEYNEKKYTYDRELQKTKDENARNMETESYKFSVDYFFFGH